MPTDGHAFILPPIEPYATGVEVAAPPQQTRGDRARVEARRDGARVRLAGPAEALLAERVDQLAGIVEMASDRVDGTAHHRSDG